MSIRKINVLSVIILIFCFSQANCQIDSLEIGAYRNSMDLRKNSPFYNTDFIFTKKDHYKIPELYTLSRTNIKLKKKIFDNGIWGIYDGESFYINAKRLGMVNGYIKIEKLGKYSYFKGKPIMSLNQQSRLNNSALNFGLIGASVSGAKIANENQADVNYVLNIETGMINLLNKDFMMLILRPYNELLSSFEYEDEPESLEVLLMYLDLVNEMPENKLYKQTSSNNFTQ
ncbi:MAG: hypothetical protein DRI54_05080 [Bacteroidetes bacterium]|nr:MAG: hypothetical protein DRI54_05080 [Bacteroidota bacterium]